MESIYCKYVAALQKFPPDLLQTQKDKIQPLFYDVNKQIQKYDDQYNILLQELGVLCPTNTTKESKAKTFFKNLQDFIQMGLSIYPEKSDGYKAFDSVETVLEDFIGGKIENFEQAKPLTKGLLLQLTKSAWFVTSPKTSMEVVAKQMGGSLKNKTRKAKRI